MARFPGAWSTLAMVRIPLSRLALIGAGLLIVAEAVAQTPAPSASSPSDTGNPRTNAAAPLSAASPQPPQAAPPKSASPTVGRPPPKAPPARPKKAAGAARRKDKDEKQPLLSGPIVTAPSFRMLDDGKSRIFLEVTQKVQVTERKARGRVVYQLKGASAPLRNSRLPLLTGFFATPIGRVELVNQGDGADLVIELRETAEPTHQLIETPRGMALQVDFPRSSGQRLAPADVPSN
jgi:hypothetical protein